MNLFLHLVPRGHSLFNEVRKSELELDLIIYSTVAGACGRCGLWREAFALITDMRLRGIEVQVQPHRM